MYKCITCKVNSCWSNCCTFTISYVTTNTQKYKITSMKKIILGGHSVALVGQAKDFHQHHIWRFPLPCTGDKIYLNAAPSPAMISCDVLTCSIHGIQQRHLILWSMIYIYMLPNLIGWMVDWLIQIVLQLEVICQFSRHYKQCQCLIFMAYTCVYTIFS